MKTIDLSNFNKNNHHISEFKQIGVNGSMSEWEALIEPKPDEYHLIMILDIMNKEIPDSEKIQQMLAHLHKWRVSTSALNALIEEIYEDRTEIKCVFKLNDADIESAFNEKSKDLLFIKMFLFISSLGAFNKYARSMPELERHIRIESKQLGIFMLSNADIHSIKQKELRPFKNLLV